MESMDMQACLYMAGLSVYGTTKKGLTIIPVIAIFQTTIKQPRD